MTNIILVANNLSATKKTYQDSSISDNDIIVRFNIAKMDKKDRTNFVLFRKTKRCYIGFKPNFKIVNPLLLRNGIKYIFISEDKNYLKKIFENYPIIRNNYEIISTHPISRKYNIKPSSGFLAIDYFTKKYPNYHIKLFNFSWEGWSGHSFNLEKNLCHQWAKDGKISIIGSKYNRNNLNKAFEINNKMKNQINYKTNISVEIIDTNNNQEETIRTIHSHNNKNSTINTNNTNNKINKYNKNNKNNKYNKHKFKSGKKLSKKSKKRSKARNIIGKRSIYKR